MAAMAGKNGLLPEQVWDGAPVPARNLYPGKPSGSAMPLAWAHAEFIKLVASRSLGRPFDAPRAVHERYHGQRPAAGRVFWSRRLPVDEMQAGQALSVLLPAAAIVHWGVDGWRAAADATTRDSGLGVQVADLPVRDLRAGQHVDFTFHWSDPDRWEGRDFRVDIV
jgi:glucoamylase